jgi:hypothetical protein
MKERLLWFVPVLALAVGMVGLRMVRAEKGLPDQERPSAYGLPTFPGGYKFKSSTENPPSLSFAYLVKDANAAQIADYYRPAMAAHGYQLEQETPLNFPVPSPKGGDKADHRAPGRRLLFTNARADRAVILMAVEQPFAGAQTQVALASGSLKELSAK